MTEDQNHVATVKDARGCQVTYDWDTKKDLLNSVKDARNSTTFYTYDAKTERLASVSKTVKAKGQDQEVKVEYGYSNDRLTRITHNGFNYGFGYDEFGKTKLPKFSVPDGYTSEQYLEKLCREGLVRRYGEEASQVEKRLDYELGVIKKMGHL